MPKTNKKTVEKTKKVVNNETNIKKAKTLLTNNGIAIAEDGTVVVDQTVQDFRSAVLVVSLAINLVILITWIVLQLTTQYDAALLQAFLSRQKLYNLQQASTCGKV